MENYGGHWDTHQNNFNMLRFHLPMLDRMLTAMLDDLEDRGLMDTTQVNVTGEMGRTPRIGKKAGRDHWPKVLSVVMAGGGMKRGYIHGTSDPTGSEPDEDPVSVPDWAATVYSLIGIDPLRRLLGPGNRPMPINYDGNILKDALT